jgi:hypothetical protein
MKSLIALLTLFWCINAQSQNFIRAYNHLPFSGSSGFIIPEDCIRLNDGRYVMVGFSGYIWITDEWGVPLSTSTIIEGNLPSSQSINYEFINDAGNNEIYMSGLTSSDSVFLVKFSLESGIIWQKGYTLEGSYLNGMITTTEGGILIVANSNRGTTQSAIPVLTKINPDGSLAWQKRYFNSNPTTGRMRWEGISLATNGDILLAGVNADPSPFTIGITRLNSEGETIWSKTFSPANNNNEYGLFLSETTEGDLRCVLGAPESGYNLATGRISSSGNWLSGKLWSGISSTPGTAHIFPDDATAITFVNNGEILYIDDEENSVFCNHYQIPGASSTIWNNVLITDGANLALFGGYTFSFFGDFSALLMTMPLTGEVAPGFSTSISISGEEYNPVLENAVITDSIGPGIFETNLSYYDLPLIFDTLFAENPTVVVNRLNHAQINVFPNPAGNKVYVAHRCAECRVALFEQNGRMLKEVDNNSDVLEFSLDDLTQGTCYIRLQTPNDLVETRKLIVTKH